MRSSWFWLVLGGCASQGPPPVAGSSEAMLVPGPCADAVGWYLAVRDGMNTLDEAARTAGDVHEVLADQRVQLYRIANEATPAAHIQAAQIRLGRDTLVHGQVINLGVTDTFIVADGSTPLFAVQVGPDPVLDRIELPLPMLTAAALGTDGVRGLDWTTAVDEAAVVEDAMALVAGARAALPPWRDVLDAEEARLGADVLACGYSLPILAPMADSWNAAQGDAARDKAVAENWHDALDLVEENGKVHEVVRSLLQQMRVMAQQASSDVWSDSQRAFLQDGYYEATDAVDAAANKTHGGLALATNGTASVSLAVELDLAVRRTLQLSDLTAQTLGVDTGSADLSTSGAAQAALVNFDFALDTVASELDEQNALHNDLLGVSP